MLIMSDGSLLLVEAAVGLGIVGVCTIPAVGSLTKQLYRREQKKDSYEDSDGKATPESLSTFSNKWAKAFVVVFASMGLGCQIAQSVLSSMHGQRGMLLADQLVLAAWALLAVQALAVAANRSPVLVYDLGLNLFMATLVHLAMGLLRSSVYLRHLYESYVPAAALVTASLVVALGLAVASISLVRRPDVYLGSRIVDRMMSTSAYQRFTFGWCSDTLKLARHKAEFKAEDLPAPNHSTRATDKAAAWKDVRQDTRPLWRSLFWAYKLPFLIQVSLSLADGAISYLPYWCQLQILGLLERRHSEEGLDSLVWFFVVALAAATLASSIIVSNMWWIGYGKLQIPMRAQLSAVIFEKSMRRKNVKSASKSDKDKARDTTCSDGGDAQTAENNGTEAATKKPDHETKQDAEGEDDEGTDQKSRQAVINLMSVDAKTIAECSTYVSQLFTSITGLVTGVWFLVALLGWIPILSGFVIWGITMPINGYFAKFFGKNYGKLMVIRDQKLAIVTEGLQGIRQIKFSALEGRWEKRILAARQRELAALWKLLISQTVVITVWFMSPIALAAVSFSVYVWKHGELTPAVAFVAVAVFNVLEEKLSSVPMILAEGVECWVSMKRIQEYLDGPELEKKTKEGPEVAFEKADIAWPADKETDESERFLLRGVDLIFPKGELSVISGQTGSGKSLLLAAILGEADILAGSIYTPKPPPLGERFDHMANQQNWILPDSFAFVGQIPWLENASLRDNILFGLPYDEGRYKETIEACALTKDIGMLPDRDKTELGPNGINISGGQKWRVTLARAVYSRAGILVLDDIFSAVDAHVGRHLLETCLVGNICKGRTRIVVTHHVGLVAPEAKYVVELADGGVAAAGLTSELEDEGILARIKSHELPHSGIAEFGGPTRRNTAELPVLEEAEEGMADEGDVDGGSLKLVRSKTGQKFVEDEKVEKGNVKWEVYETYIRESGGWFWWALAMVLFLVSQALVLGRTWWLKIWTQNYEGDTSSHLNYHAYPYTSMIQQTTIQVNNQPANPQAEHSPGFYLAIYVGITLISSLFQSLRYLYMFVLGLKASRSMFEKMTFSVLRTPLRWVDTVPVGRVLNRFTADFNAIDMQLVWSVAAVGGATLQVLGICAAAVFVSPYILILAAFLLGVCGALGRQYLGGARPLKRLESTTKSPIFELFGTALAGVSTLRGFGKAQAYVTRMHAQLDDYSMATWYLFLFNSWIGWRLSLIGVVYTTVVVSIIVTMPGMTAALAGFAISFTVKLSILVQALIQTLSRIELDMNAAERIVEYTGLETEDLGGEKPPAAWPTRGEIEIEKLVVRYAPDLPPVLKDVGFTVRQHERIGIVGRTGSGKSTLTLSLFRFLEPSSGAIYIDGLDISKIALQELRSRLAIIPQDPVLFSGTLRSNIDPFDDYTDAEIHDCLQRVHLVSSSDSDSNTQVSFDTQVVSEPGPPTTETTQTESMWTVPPAQKNVSIFKDLTSPISEGGQNLSQGQRQLLCIARAIISRPKIMVLDEATSAVDMLTDTLIQRSIREEFANATLMVIAHRLSTIADFDRILVLDNGTVAEFGSPAELWHKEGGRFRAMCDESGEKGKLEAIINEIRMASLRNRRR